MAKVTTFSSKIGLVAATVGSAVGLGNIWRFPAVTQANGGAAFLIIYIACVILLGIPVMLTEFSIGRAGRGDAVGAMRTLGAPPAWRSVGGLSVLAAFIITGFYMVVAGWTVEYLWQSLTGDLYAPAADGDMKGAFAARMTEYISETWRPLTATFVLILLNTGILLTGVQKGIERLSNILMPMLFALLAVFCVQSLTLPDAGEGVAFFLKPDWGSVTPQTWLNALGQAFFSLSLGMGILVTYSSYFPNDTKLGRTAVTVSLLDLLVAVMMGLIIFPAVMSFGLEGEGMEGATLVFVTLPEVFAHMPATRLWSVLFFLLLAVAALTSTISTAEVVVAWVRDRFRLSRPKAVLAVMTPVVAVSTVCSLSQGVLSDVTVFGQNLFNFLDTMATNVMLPVVSIGLCVWAGWFGPADLLERELTNGGKLRAPLAGAVRIIVRWLAPLLIAIVFVCGFM